MEHLPHSPSGCPLVEDLPPAWIMRANFQQENPDLDFDAPFVQRSGTFAGWDAAGNWTARLADGSVVGGKRRNLSTLDPFHTGRPYTQQPIRGGLRHGMPLIISFLGDKAWSATARQGEAPMAWSVMRQMIWHLGWRPH